MSRQSDIGDAIVTRLNAGEFSIEFTAERRYVPYKELKDLDTIAVTVVANGWEATPFDRERHGHVYAFDIVTQKQVNPDTTADVDTLDGLAEEFADDLAGLNLGASGEYTWMKTVFIAQYNPEFMLNAELYTSAIRVFYREVV